MGGGEVVTWLRHRCANYPLKWAPSVFDIWLNWNQNSFRGCCKVPALQTHNGLCQHWGLVITLLTSFLIPHLGFGPLLFLQQVQSEDTESREERFNIYLSLACNNAYIYLRSIVMHTSDSLRLKAAIDALNSGSSDSSSFLCFSFSVFLASDFFAAFKSASVYKTSHYVIHYKSDDIMM